MPILIHTRARAERTAAAATRRRARARAIYATSGAYDMPYDKDGWLAERALRRNAKREHAHSAVIYDIKGIYTPAALIWRARPSVPLLPRAARRAARAKIFVDGDAVIITLIYIRCPARARVVL